MSSNIQNKLLNYEVPPPPGMWEKLAAGLEEQHNNDFAKRLYQYEQNPPYTIWERIANSLRAPVIPFHKKYRRPLKYSGAAAVFIVIAMLSSLLLSKKTESEIPAGNLANSSMTSTQKDAGPSTATASTGEKKEVVTAGYTKNISNNLSTHKNTNRFRTLASISSFSFLENFLPSIAPKKDNIKLNTGPDKYMVYTDNDGNAVRLPKKLFDAYACSTDRENCQEKLNQLRQKMAEATVNSNFTGIIEILNNLQENQ